MHRAFFEGQFPGVRRDSPRDWIDGPDVLAAYVAERDGEVVGHVAVTSVGVEGTSGLRWREITGHPTSDLAEVAQLFVRPSFRGQGIGRSLVDAALADIRSRGLVPVLEVVTHSSVAPSYAYGHGWRLRRPTGSTARRRVCGCTGSRRRRPPEAGPRGIRRLGPPTTSGVSHERERRPVPSRG